MLGTPMFTLAFGGSTETPRGVSMLPLNDRLHLQHFGAETKPLANSEYTGRRRRRLQTMTAENTQRIRIVTDYASLYEETAPQYSACFTVGAWFARGLPGPDPPADGIATCNRNGQDSDCWGRCLEDDLITPAGRDLVIGIVDRVTAEVENLFSVQPTGEALVFNNDNGRYSGALESKGYPPEAACARDCRVLNGVHADDMYCTSGVDADAVFSIVKPPGIPGVAGTGGACANERSGRPTWLVFTWIQSIATMTGTVDELVEEHRGLVIHELLHALGFSNVQFRSARDGSGNRKDLIELKPIVDLDSSEDEVWYFTKGRAYELAQTYFGCSDNSSWDGLPLMGLPDLGRASHWETRIMRDDVMTYGGFPTVSAITLAAMEDLGYYLANYSAAQCMSWGYKQGCNYVVTRCGAGINDQSAIAEDQDECEGNSQWANKYDAYLMQKCEGGLDPCSSNAAAGYEFVGGEERCNAQCYSGPNREGCTAAPKAVLETAGEGGLSELVPEVNWEQFLFIGAWLLGALVFVGFMRQFLCPKPGSRRVLGIASCIIFLAGMSCVVFNLLILLKIDTFPTLDMLSQQVEQFLGQYVLVGNMSVGLLLAVISLFSLIGITRASANLMLFVWWLWMILFVVEMVGAILFCYWIYVLDDVPNSALATLQGDSGGRYDGKLGADILVEIEGFMCQTYVKCCRDPILDLPVAEAEVGSGSGEDATPAHTTGNRTCIYAHEGTVTDVEISLEDPSSANFCPYVTGSTVRIAPPTGICNPLDHVYSLDTCREHFCTAGAEGYFDFLMNLVAFIREYATWIGGGFSLLVLVQLVLMLNLWNLRHRFREQDKMAEETAAAEREADSQARLDGRATSGDGLQIGVDPVSGSKRSSTKPSRSSVKSSTKGKDGGKAAKIGDYDLRSV